MVKISCRSVAAFGCMHARGMGLTDVMTLGSTQRTATSFIESAVRTRAATFTEGLSCSSADVATPTAR